MGRVSESKGLVTVVDLGPERGDGGLSLGDLGPVAQVGH